MSKSTPNEHSHWRPSHNPWAIALTVTIATFMEVLDTAIANVSLPHIAGSLSASQDEATWVLTSYLVANAVVLPLSAWVSDRVGRKRFYMTCVLLFTISSFLCGLAPNLGLLIFFRVLQGIGGGGLAPSEQAILADTFEPAKRGVAFAVYGMAVVLAPAIGPTLGGFITDHYSWHWIFFINVPVGVFSLFLTSHFVEDPPQLQEATKKSRGLSIDYLGAGLIAIALGSLEVVLDKGQEDDWFSSSFIVFFTVLALVSLAVFLTYEWQQEHPILNLRLFQNRNFAVCTVLMLTLGGVLYGTTVLIPQFVQTVLGYTAQLAGEVLTPGGFVVILCLPLVGRLVSKVDARYLIAFGFISSALALLHMTNLYAGISFRSAVLFRVYQAIGLAFLFVPINTIAYIGIPPDQNGQVSAIINLCRNLGGSIGIATLTTLLARRTQVHQDYLVSHITSGNAPLQSSLTSISQGLRHAGVGAVDAVSQAYGQIARTVGQQANILAYIDVIEIFAIVCLAVVPLLFLARRSEAGRAPAAH
ncbi:MAG: DHA2 family efflux MFS transporter permease subunit [Chthoniobacterales bacterium]|nr:DHA2 family efflux MFS transporter permease subunit [Chthoniobacterales bacterium]